MHAPNPLDPLLERAWQCSMAGDVASALPLAQQAYAQGRSTQIPAHTTFNTGQRRISRKITVGISTVRYENDYKPRA